MMELNPSCHTCRHMSFCAKYHALTQALVQVPPLLRLDAAAPVTAPAAQGTIFTTTATACPEYQSLSEIRIGPTMLVEGRPRRIATAAFCCYPGEPVLDLIFHAEAELIRFELLPDQTAWVTDREGQRRQIVEYRF